MAFHCMISPMRAIGADFVDTERRKAGKPDFR